MHQNDRRSTTPINMYLIILDQKQFVTRDLRHTISSHKKQLVNIGIEFDTVIFG